MKTLSVIVPCYNSADYMERCINSLVIGGDLVEIIIVNDGSSDRTGAIANQYCEKFPSIIKVIHQDNGGHGEAINAGLKKSTGQYIKVVDSDDWVDAKAYKEILKLLSKHQDNQKIDMIISNYVYEKQGQKHKKIVNYRNLLPIGRIFNWEDVKSQIGKYILMHSVIYRLDILKASGMMLPKKTYYVDNIYVFTPLPWVKNIYYLDVNFYRYFIGRDDQSVNEKNMIERIDQQIMVNKMMIEYYSKSNQGGENLQIYMYRYLEIITTISSVLLTIDNSPESRHKKKELWCYIREIDKNLYQQLRYGCFGLLLHLPGKTGRKVIASVYHISQKIYGFN